MESIKGQTCIITGASSGIGRASVLALADEGVNLVLTARREERLKEVCAECEKKGVRAVYYAGDASEEKTAVATVRLALDAFGRIDMLLSNAGIGIYKPFEIGNGRTQEQMERKKETTLSAEDLAEAVVYTFTRRKGIRIMEMYLAGMQGD